MAISKILNMKDCGGHFHGKHLKRSLDYVMNPEKTQDGRLVGAINCQVDSAFEQMKATKRKFGKVDKRQGYHIILSFREDEVNPDMAFEITRRFVEEYLGKSYEAVYVVHDNTAHVHSHIVFNSVSFVDGKKYRYEKGDWAKYIQPITNKLCQEYGLSIIDVDDGNKEKEHESYKDWSEYREGSFVWADMIKRDLDSCILQAGNYEQFLELLSDKGYEVKQGKYLAVKPQGMTRFRRCKTLGDMYSDEAIRERIEKEDISFYREQQKEVQPVLCKCKVRRYRRAKMSGLQKRYYAKLYRIGKLKKKPYSQVWKYKEDIRKMHKLQEEYLFLVNHDIHSAEELVSIISSLTDKRKEVVDFCDSYYNMDMVIVVDENEEDINSSQDLINKIVGSQPACPEAEYLKTIDVTEAVEYSKIPDGILDLKNGRIDAFLTESLSGGYYAKNTECKVIFDEELPSFDVGIATNKECPELTEAINTAIKELKDDGTLSEISEKWFGMDIISEN